ncbi:hypothetical protein B1222_21180 [Paenibacillus larvae subsp. pulvifaciens]|uniref:hypothetical protein n=1 Tax=Paenibacillus larvae TaxID=1464 RepID=UPI00098FD289|nr:hypothetical protein [Paenibacillus larvae]AQT86353.1 hypothetical protein B1222_21180 [Paenibacillus larvae subsp. pulvifaciens]AQZ48003.1 hypothetical protein B5S25_16820 [Paenibacillus larvae subsp. pulvifaciens]MBH0342110.1 hypothetical protein [Paenibacillus larvae]MCY7522319.1 hypothetical protein [Paenibacillus larvae]MEC0088626.1 hypothetical protein [Paenibacillus larvae]
MVIGEEYLSSYIYIVHHYPYIAYIGFLKLEGTKLIVCCFLYFACLTVGITMNINGRKKQGGLFTEMLQAIKTADLFSPVYLKRKA